MTKLRSIIYLSVYLAVLVTLRIAASRVFPTLPDSANDRDPGAARTGVAAALICTSVVQAERLGPNERPSAPPPGMLEVRLLIPGEDS